MPRSLSFAIIFAFFAAFSAAAQSPDTSSPAASPQSQDSAPPAETKKPKKVWTNENLSSATGTVSVAGDPKSQPKPATSKPVNAQYVASVRKQLEKLQGQIAEIDKQLVDRKKFSEGELPPPATVAKLTRSN